MDELTSNPVELASIVANRVIDAGNNGVARPKGQRFTSPGVARFMASQVDALPPTIRILDPGAGVGILTAALCERIGRVPLPVDLPDVTGE